ncbi:MAG: efflux RND transporter periplasmic adaptor subunit [Acidobacteriota bacterium]
MQGGLSACAPATGVWPAADPSGALLSVHRGEFIRDLLLTGELEAVRSISIKAPQTAVFQMRIQFMAEEGKLVHAGDPLLGFDNSSLVAQVRELETKILDAQLQIVTARNEVASALKDLEIELAEKEYEDGHARVEASVDASIMSRKEYGERQLAMDEAARQLDETRERIELTRRKGQADVDVLVIERDKLRKDLIKAQKDVDLLSIKAPSDGLVVYRKRPNTTLRFQEGDSCWPGQEVIQLPDMGRMQVLFTVSEVDAPKLRAGMPVRVTLDAFPGREVAAEVLNIPSMAVKRTGDSDLAVFKVTAELSETWPDEMKPGMAVLGRVEVQRRRNAPMLARDAVRFDGVNYWLDAGSAGEGPARGRRVEPVARNAAWYLISEAEFARLTRPSGRAVSSGAILEGGS